MLTISLVFCLCGLREVVGSIPAGHEIGIQNCSWSSYNSYSTQVEDYGCEITIKKEEALSYDACPNPIKTESGKPNIFPGATINLSANFFSIPSQESEADDATDICVNITFGFQSDSAEKLKGVQIMLFGISYLSLGNNYCQNYKFTSQMDSCAVLDNRCDLDAHKVFYYDCFCDIQPNSKYHVSVVPLPLHTDDDHSLSRPSLEIHSPKCSEDSKEKYCTSPKESWWRTLILKAEQGCNLNTIDVTFTIAPSDYHIKEYVVALYDSKKRRPVDTPSFLAPKNINFHEVNISGITVNITTISFTVEDDDIIYYPSVQADHWPRQFNSSSLVTLEIPCKNNPCGNHGNCSYTKCTEYTCQCHEGFTKIHDICGDGSDIDDIIADQGAPPFSIYLTFDTVDPILLVRTYTVGVFRPSNLSKPILIEIVQVADPSSQRSVALTLKNTSALVSKEIYIPGVKISEAECPNCTFVFGSNSEFTFYVNACLPLSNPCGQYTCVVEKKGEHRCTPCNPGQMLIFSTCRDFKFIIFGIAAPIVLFMLAVMILLRSKGIKNFCKDHAFRTKDRDEEPPKIISCAQVSVCIIFNSESTIVFQEIALELSKQLCKIPRITAFPIRCNKICKHVINESGQKVDYILQQLTKDLKVILLADNVDGGSGEVVELARELTETMYKEQELITHCTSKVTVVFLEPLGKPFIPNCPLLMMDARRDFESLIEVLLKSESIGNNVDEYAGAVSSLYDLEQLSEKIDDLTGEMENSRIWTKEPDDSDGSSVKSLSSVGTMVSLPSRFKALQMSPGEFKNVEEVDETSVSVFSIAV